MVKTQRTAMTLALGMLLVLFSTAFAAAPAQASMSRTAAAPPPSSQQLPQQLQAGWSGWGEVPGNGFTLTGPAPTFDQVNDYVFVRGTDNHLYVNAFNGTTWSGWRGVPGHGLTPSAPAATTSGTTVSLFVRGTDNRIYRNTLNGTTWSGWSQVPGNGLTSDTPNALANGTTLSLFVRGTDNRIYMNTFNGTTWSGWREVPGHELTLSGPTTNISTSSKGTFLNLFVRGTNNHLFVNTTFDGTTWSGWSEVPGHELTPSAPAATTLYLTGVPSNTLYLFVRGTDNKIYVNTFANGMTWSGWSQVLGNGLTPDAPGAVAGATSGTAGFVALYVRGTNDRIYLNVLGVG